LRESEIKKGTLAQNCQKIIQKNWRWHKKWKSRSLSKYKNMNFYKKRNQKPNEKKFEHGKLKKGKWPQRIKSK